MAPAVLTVKQKLGSGSSQEKVNAYVQISKHQVKTWLHMSVVTRKPNNMMQLLSQNGESLAPAFRMGKESMGPAAHIERKERKRKA